MVCKNHFNRQAYNKCSVCGDYVCTECDVTVNGSCVCKNCASEIISSKGDGKYVESSKRRSSGFLLFLFSGLPGLNYMYLGLIKRGIFIMSSFLFITLFAGYLDMPILGIASMIIFFASFFDSFKVRRKLSRGIYVEDSFDDIVSSIDKYKGIIIIAILLSLGLGFTNRLEGLFYSNGFLSFIGGGLKVVFALFVFLVGVVLLKKHTNKSDDIIDNRDTLN